MKTIFIIDGTSGIWKSDLIHYVSNCQIKSGILMKSSTRPRNSDEKSIDLKFMDNELFDSFDFDYHYSYDSYRYGFFKKDILDLMARVDNVFIIIRNLDVIKKISDEFSNENIVTVFIYTDFDVVSKRIQNANDMKHKKSITETFQDYLRHPDVYNEIIINGGTVNDFNHLINLTVTKFSNYKTINIYKSTFLDNKIPQSNYTQVSKMIVAKIILPVIIGSFTTIFMHNFIVGKLSISNLFLLQFVLIGSSLSAYFIPQFLIYGFIKSKEQFEKNKIWFEFLYVFLAIIAYVIIIFYYTIGKH